ncbi:Crp/Fnr family transcriptional regulator [Magnetospirillum sp. UT-4]|uniref:Crp/Fnr family transcriptional regulator n=1 Tax=Magnetospirillum sp. UT-4 TaxID=2681467 RepID=UPI00137EC477|nr:cyclic nucleotide-binding domain-containing protein [Magnetospirillum sp. UT-4]CAA7619434.1 cAMP-binding proteins-catabolite gene activator and regulatory subunit of cAMP-dependent protein kinases [Magnetospirillum sp. UT-4]
MTATLGKDVLLQLQFTPLFSGLQEGDIRDLVAGAVIEAHGHEAQLYAAGDPVERFYVVLDGHVELSIDAEGRRSVVEVARKGTVLGDAAMFGDGRFLMTARALTGATLLAVPAESFLAKLEARFDIITHMLSTMSFRLRMLVRQIAELKLKTTAQRLGSFLLSMVEAEEGAVSVRFPYDKKLVADELGMKPESLSRALAKLAKVGVESKADNVVRIADIERLRDFCVEDDLA